MNADKSKVIRELNACIAKAWGEKESTSILQDPALARNLEWIRDCYERNSIDWTTIGR